MNGWEVGDLALCIKLGQWVRVMSGIESTGPSFNEINRVRKVGIGKTGLTVIWFDEYQGDGLSAAFSARRFKRIKPDTEGANEDDAAWLKDLLTKKVKA